MKDWSVTFGLLLLGTAGGFLALFVGAPMPFLLGALTVVGASLVFRILPLAETYNFPEPLRRVFIALIGALIGATFSTEALPVLQSAWVTLLAIIFFVPIAHVLNFAIFRAGGFDKVTAFYAGMPGGLIEATTLGEEAGANPGILALQQFLRIILTIVIVPLLFLILSGEAVGSAGGQTFETSGASLISIPIITAIALIGSWIGGRLRLPAGPFLGPLLLSAAFHASGMVDTSSPGWLVQLAQLVVGTALGARFAGITYGHLIRAGGLGLATVAAMMLLGGAIAFLFAAQVGQTGDVVFIAFAPGGVTEMSLIALSLEASPIFVSIHHLVRIMFAVILIRPMARAFGASKEPSR